MERNAIKDVRREPLRIFGYAISITNERRLKVVVDQPRFLELKAYLVGLSVHRRRDTLIQVIGKEFRNLEAYAGVRAQMRQIVDAVNEARKGTGFETVPVGIIPRGRSAKRPFADGYYETR
jgi:hypothetical protein